MGAAGIIVEYNPLHSGHLRLLEAGRAALGPDTAMVCVMSGNFVQRGDFALLRKHARARAAVESGADLVLELPLPWAVSSAEGFAAGGVQALAATGVVEHLLFGSECGDVSALERVAAALLAPSFRDRLREVLPGAVSFAAARQRALTGLLPEEDAALLESPNNILGIEYCKALLGQNAPLRPVTIRREGSAHDGALAPDTHPSASGLRALLRQGKRKEALSLLPPAMARAYELEEAAGRAPVFWENSHRAILARLRSMTAADFAALDQGHLESTVRRLPRCRLAARTAGRSQDEALRHGPPAADGAVGLPGTDARRYAGAGALSAGAGGQWDRLPTALPDAGGGSRAGADQAGAGPAVGPGGPAPV